MKLSKKLAMIAAAVAVLAALLTGHGHQTARDAGCYPSAACPIFGPIHTIGK